MNSYKKLINNSMIFALGSLGSKLVSFFLVPLYTYYLQTNEFGSAELVTTSVSMLIPIVSLSMYEAVLRFVMEKDVSHNNILTNTLFIAICGVVISILLYPLASHLNLLGDHLHYMYILLIVQVIERIFAQFARGIGKIKIYAINGVLLTFTTGILNVLFLAGLNMGVAGYFMSTILSFLISIIYLVFALRIFNYIKFSSLNFDIAKRLIKYSTPLIPNALMWWLINASSRFFIVFFVGLGANGLFAVASRIPSIMNIVSQIFNQAWQLSAIEEFERNKGSSFYTEIFGYFSSFMLITMSAIIVIIKPSFQFLFNETYFNAWQAAPFLLLSAVFSSFTSFFGAIYVANKTTGGVFKTSVFGGIISLILNIILIPFIGIIGAGISSCISFFVIFLLRLSDTKKIISLSVNWKRLNFNVLIILLQISVLFINMSILNEITLNFILLIVLILINQHLLKLALRIYNSLIIRIKR